MKKALVIFSGGQDSTTCLYWAIKKFDQVQTITFAYGQKHSIEIDCAKNICHSEGIDHKIIDISFLDQLVDSALTSGGDVNKLNDKGLPASFVPNRNQLFITLAHSYAQKIGAQHLVTGVCQTDYSGYPDCRQIFIDLLSHCTNYGSQSNIVIHTPLMHLSKSRIFQLADELGKLKDIVLYTHTCYNGNRNELHSWGYGCVECPACILRHTGFYEYMDMKALQINSIR